MSKNQLKNAVSLSNTRSQVCVRVPSGMKREMGVSLSAIVAPVV